jgi:hypothetical protein
MADNDNVTGASGTIAVATDERVINAATVKVQRVGELGNSAQANGQVAASTTAATLIAARDTRKLVTVVNTGSTTVYVGVATVTAANGAKILPGAGRDFRSTVLLQLIVASGTGSVDYVETYDA